MEEIVTKTNVLQQDAIDSGIDSETNKSESEMSDEKKTSIVSLWKSRFNKAENFRRPYVDKWIRMYYLYRAYREKLNYGYQTSIMPPIGFEIIETIRPRLTAAEVKVNFYPVSKENIDNEFINDWDGLVEYDFQEMDFEENKIQWIAAMLLFGNGVAQLSWKGGKPYMEIVDNLLFYPDPQAMNRLKNSRWEIKQIFKDKAIIKEEEEKRDDDKKLYPLVTDWEKIENLPQQGHDDRVRRYEINTKKMSQVNSGSFYTSDGKDNYTSNDNDSKTSDKNDGEKSVEIWECWDHVTHELVYIFNRETLARKTENPYKDINGGQTFFDLPDIVLNWEYYAMGHLEPVETTIIEIADSRNQAMDDIVFTLDPIRKIKKGSGIKPSDIIHRPGAVWELANANDVVIETPPTISDVWIAKDNLLKRDIQTALALSEYTQGIPKSGQEPASKVEVLLNQTNIRLAQNVRQMEIVFSEFVNSIIKMNGEFLVLEGPYQYRIFGKNKKPRFGEFRQEAKNIDVDAYVDISTKKEKTAEQEANEALELYKMFVVEDQPNPNDEAERSQWKKKKSVLQKLILEKLGYEAYIDKLIFAEQESPKQIQNQSNQIKIEESPAEQPGGELPNQEIPIIQPEEALSSQAENVESVSVPSEQKKNTIQGLLQRVLRK